LLSFCLIRLFLFWLYFSASCPIPDDPFLNFSCCFYPFSRFGFAGFFPAAQADGGPCSPVLFFISPSVLPWFSFWNVCPPVPVGSYRSHPYPLHVTPFFLVSRDRFDPVEESSHFDTFSFPPKVEPRPLHSLLCYLLRTTAVVSSFLIFSRAPSTTLPFVSYPCLVSRYG